MSTSNISNDPDSSASSNEGGDYQSNFNFPGALQCEFKADFPTIPPWPLEYPYPFAFNTLPPDSKAFERPYFFCGPPRTDEAVRSAQEINSSYVMNLQMQMNQTNCPELPPETVELEVRRATAILRKRVDLEPVKTTIQELDDHKFIGGIWPYTIVEFVGTNIFDKSQFCYRVIANYLCTARDFHVVLFTASNSCSATAVDQVAQSLGETSSVLPRLHIHNVFTVCDLMAAFYLLKVRHINHFEVGLVVLDNVQVHLEDVVNGTPPYTDIHIITKFFQSMKVLSVTAKFPVLVTSDASLELVGTEVEPMTFEDERYREYIDLRVWMHVVMNPKPQWTANVVKPMKKSIPIKHFQDGLL